MTSTTTFTKPHRPLTWLITGCSSGVGLSLARYVQSQGHSVIATSRNPAGNPDLVSEIESKSGSQWLALDVDDASSGRVLIDQLEASGRAIDVLVNNAGLCIFAPVEAATDAQVRQQMESMYFGPLRLIQAVLPYMRKRKFGVIVNISSGASLNAAESMGAYAGAKAGLDGITRVLAKEIAPFNIRTLTAILGTFNTNFGTPTPDKFPAIPEAYRDSGSDKLIQIISGGKFPAINDKEKGARALFDVVVGQGAGVGREAEPFLPLGSDMAVRVKGVRDAMAHSLEVFEDVTNSVGVDK